MATVDGFVSQHDVVGHSQAGNLNKEKIFVDDYGLGDFGSDDCSFLAISSEWVDIPDVHVDLDKSKLVLLKQKIKNKNNNTHSIHRIPLSSKENKINNMASISDTNNKSKKRRRRRKKNKSMMINKSGLDVEIINCIFIPSTTPVLEMECAPGISIPSSLLNNDLCDGSQQQQQQHKKLCISDSLNLDRAAQHRNLDSVMLSVDGTLSYGISHSSNDCSISINSGNPHSDNAHSIDVDEDDDSARQEHKQHLHIDSSSPIYPQADLVLQTHQPANYDSNSGTYGGHDDGYSSPILQSSISCIQNQNLGIELHQQIQSHPGVIINDMESGFISLIVITKDMNDYARKYGEGIGIVKSSLKDLQILFMDDMDTFSFSKLQIDLNLPDTGDEFYPLKYLVGDLLQKCIQYEGRIGCDKQSLQKLKFLFIGSLSSLNSPNSNKNNNHQYNNNKNNSNSRHNNSRRFQYSRRRGRKKRQYKMVYKNKLQNVKCKQFGNDDKYGNYHNSVVHTKLVTARAPRCAPISKE